MTVGSHEFHVFLQMIEDILKRKELLMV